jgi:hypothetical protein
MTSRTVSTGFRRSHLARFVWQRVIILKSDGERRRSFDRPAAGLKRLRELADRHQFEVLETISPLFEDFENYPRRAEHDWVRSEARGNGFEVVDLLDVFKIKSKGNPKQTAGTVSTRASR